MKVGVLMMGAALLLGTAVAGIAGEVNCKQVNKYLQTGRSAKDIAETMVISEADVKKCQDQAGGDQKAGEGQKAGDAGKGEAGSK
jgi:hypothetical protein